MFVYFAFKSELPFILSFSRSLARFPSLSNRFFYPVNLSEYPWCGNGIYRTEAEFVLIWFPVHSRTITDLYTVHQKNTVWHCLSRIHNSLVIITIIRDSMVLNQNATMELLKIANLRHLMYAESPSLRTYSYSSIRKIMRTCAWFKYSIQIQRIVIFSAMENNFTVEFTMVPINKIHCRMHR